MSTATRRIRGQDSWVITSDTVELAVTMTGGMMAPVTFYPDSNRPLRPYSIAPWAEEDRETDPPVLGPLRGDFFCLPFGANAGTDGRHTVHGATATKPWTLMASEEQDGSAAIELGMDVADPPLRVTKRLRLRSGEPVVYTQHELAGGDGAFPLGHHATLAPPPSGKLRISTSEIRFGMTSPRADGPMVADEYFALPPLTEFERLDAVPTIWPSPASIDCSVFPRMDGFSDILSVFAADGIRVAWTAALADEAGYLWFSLKDPGLLPATLFWIEERGRRGEPWLGRNRCLGLEEICGYYADGLPIAAQPNTLTRRGIPTAVQLRPDAPTVINTIQGCVRVPPGFTRVRDARVEPDHVVFFGGEGQEVAVQVRSEFILSGTL